MKKWYESKTVLFNILMTGILIDELIAGLFMDLAPITSLISGIGNIILRVWFTDTNVKKSIK